MINIDFYNIKEKIFLNGKKQIIIYSNSNIEGRPSPNKGKTNKRIKEKYIDDEININEFEHLNNRSNKRSKRRTINMIYDYAKNNEWEYFITLTFNPQKVDSFNYDECSEKVSMWLNNSRKTNLDMKYLGVPELHKSGRFHFHFLMSNIENFKLVDSGQYTIKGLTIYNVDNYRWGFSTATKIENNIAVTNYIGKYITKDLTSVTSGKKRYWNSRNLDLPQENKFYNENLKEVIEELENDENLLFTKTLEKEYIDNFGKVRKGYIKYFELDN